MKVFGKFGWLIIVGGVMVFLEKVRFLVGEFMMFIWKKRMILGIGFFKYVKDIFVLSVI